MVTKKKKINIGVFYVLSLQEVYNFSKFRFPHL